MLIHYDPSKELELSLQYQLGAVLSQRSDDGTEQPVYFALRVLSSTKQKYSQTDKEDLAIICGVKRFYEYLL